MEVEDCASQDPKSSDSMKYNIWEIHRKKWFRKFDRSVTSSHEFKCKVPNISTALDLTLVISPLSRSLFQVQIEIPNTVVQTESNSKVTTWCRITNSYKISIPIEMDKSAVQVTTDLSSIRDQKKIFMPILKKNAENTCKESTNNALVINLVVIFLTPIRETPYSIKSQMYLKSISTFIKQNPDEGDIEIICEGKTFKTHKLLLLSHSEVFRSMFRHKMQESITNTVNIANSSQIAVEALVSYLHTTSINEDLHIEDLLELTSLASKYLIPELLEGCSDLLGRKMDIDHSPQSLIVAHNLKLNSLKEMLLEFIKENFDEVKLLKDWETLYENYPCLVEQFITKCITSNKTTIKGRKSDNWDA